MEDSKNFYLIIMKSIKQLEKKISKENRRISLNEPSRILADFFNGIIIEIEEDYVYES